MPAFSTRPVGRQNAQARARRGKSRERDHKQGELIRPRLLPRGKDAAGGRTIGPHDGTVNLKHLLAIVRRRATPPEYHNRVEVDVDAFHFEEQVSICRRTYMRLHGVERRRNWYRMAFWTVTTIALTVFAPTRWIGLALVLVILAAALLYLLMLLGLRWQYETQAKHLHTPVICGVSDQGLWVHGTGVDIRFPWHHLSGWNCGDGWMWLARHGGGVAYFRIASLREAGVYGAVMQAARSQVPQGEGSRRRSGGTDRSA